VYIPSGMRPRAGDARIVIEQIDLVHRLIARYPDDLELALTADDIVRIHREGRIASLIGMEGGHSIENSLAVLRATYDLGARYMTLTHWHNTLWADAATVEFRRVPYDVELTQRLIRNQGLPTRLAERLRYGR
jgi:membrane dipeptidase